jgi:hypothetical protein
MSESLSLRFKTTVVPHQVSEGFSICPYLYSYEHLRPSGWEGLTAFFKNTGLA